MYFRNIRNKIFLKKEFFLALKENERAQIERALVQPKRNCKKNPKYILVKFNNINSDEKF